MIMRELFVSGVCVAIGALSIVAAPSEEVPPLPDHVRAGPPLQYTVDGKQKQLEIETRVIAPEAEGSLGTRCVVYRVTRYAVDRDLRSKASEGLVWQWWQRYYSNARPLPFLTALLAEDAANASFYVVVGRSMSYYLTVEVYRLDAEADRKLEQPRFDRSAVKAAPNEEPIASYKVTFNPSQGGAKTIEARIEDGEIVFTPIRHNAKLGTYEIRYDLKSSTWSEGSVSESTDASRE